ncbi:GDCCVxC domain-containing (seleno)protein [Jatrophihabitans sp.]|uniref:GDCCVxC domain-containing (seleno)protein n=1 Tax=Jatrophihabitans sp. TaxID=1932789 RepID=UPI002BC517F5|nr:GDCCVxC domain-containing (seleno)protein [Jatrophihabitans sp.]
MAVLTSVITCPVCGEQARAVMPENACQHFYRCTGCGETLKPRVGDCCVFCSYGDARCPPVQAEATSG